MQRCIAALLAVASCASIAQGQVGTAAVTAAPLTLERALALAGTSSPTLDAAAAGVRSAGAAGAVARLRPNPEFSLTTENIAGEGLYRGTRSAETAAQIGLPVELGGKRSARIALAETSSDRARIAAAIAEADVRLAVTQSYTAAIAADRRLAIAEAQARIAAEAARGAGEMLAAGRSAPLEMQRAALARLQADAAVERDRRLAEVARADLARRIGQPIAGPLDSAWFDRIGAAGPARPVDVATTLAMVSAEADVRMAEAQLRLARTQRTPDVVLSAAARRLAQTNDTVAVVGISVPLQLFNRGDAAVAQASADRDQLAALRQAAERDAAQALSLAEAEVATAATMARNAAGPALALAEEAVRLARIGRREGKFGLSDMLAAERGLADAQAAATEALLAYHDAVARRERLVAPAPVVAKD